MERFLEENFGGVKPKNSSEEVLQRWRELCGVVKNPKRRFRFTANLSKRGEAAAMRQNNQEKLRIAVLVSKAAFQFIQGVQPSDYTVPEEVKAAGFHICADELGSIVEGHDPRSLNIMGGLKGLLGSSVHQQQMGLMLMLMHSTVGKRFMESTNLLRANRGVSWCLFGKPFKT